MSPAASYVTVVFLGAPAGIFDFASFSFQVPMWGLSKKPTTTVAKNSGSIKEIAFAFM
jgi:hypothetical protein